MLASLIERGIALVAGILIYAEICQGVPGVASAAAASKPWLPPDRLHDWFYAGRTTAVQGASGLKTFNVKTRFHAKGDAKADDSSALKAAVAAASVKGGVVFLPKGTYRLSNLLVVNKSNVVLRGAGIGMTKIVVTRPLADMFDAAWIQRCWGDNWTTEQTPWSFGGAFITLSGTTQRSTDTATLLATVTKPAEAGSKQLQVDSAAKFKVGQWIRIFLNDASTSLEEPASANYDAIWKGCAPQKRMLPNTIGSYIYGEGLASEGPDSPIFQDYLSLFALVKSVNASAKSVELDRPLQLPIRVGQGWEAKVHAFRPTLQHSGVEELTIDFPTSGQYTSHFASRGFNAISMHSAANCWVKNVEVINSDNALFVSKSHFNTLSGIRTGVTHVRFVDKKEHSGHHAIKLDASSNNLVQGFSFGVKFRHDLTVDWGSCFNVFHAGSGVDLTLDHHRAANFGNLFSNLDMGQGTRPFDSGGSSATGGAHSGRHNTFWNLHPAHASQPLLLPTCDFGPLLTFVLPRYSGDNCPAMRWMVQKWTSAMPKDLFNAQLAQFAKRRRLRMRKALPVT